MIGRDDEDGIGIVVGVSFIFEKGVKFVYFFSGEHEMGDDGEVDLGFFNCLQKMNTKQTR